MVSWNKSNFVPLKIFFREAVVQRCSVKKVFLEISQNSQENTCTRASFFTKRPEAWNFIKKETLAQVFSYEFYEISKNTFSYRTHLVAASVFKKSGFTYVSFLVNKEFQVSICTTSTSYFFWPTMLNALAITYRSYL